MSVEAQTRLIEASLSLLVLLLAASLVAIARFPRDGIAPPVAGQEEPAMSAATADPDRRSAPPAQPNRAMPVLPPARRGGAWSGRRRYTPRHVRGHVPLA